MRKKLSLNLILALILFAALIGVVLFFLKPIFPILADPELTKSFVKSQGPWAPVVFITLQLLQVFFAPIPGQFIGFAGGYLFGTFLGTLYSMIGATIGFAAIFYLSRKLGRPFVEYFVRPELLKKFDYLVETKGVFALFLIFLLPVFPDDMICFIAGLSRIKIRTLILISIFGRLPGYLVLSFTGNGVAEANTFFVSIVFGVAMILSGLVYWHREKIEHHFKKFK